MSTPTTWEEQYDAKCKELMITQLRLRAAKKIMTRSYESLREQHSTSLQLAQTQQMLADALRRSLMFELQLQQQPHTSSVNTSVVPEALNETNPHKTPHSNRENMPPPKPLTAKKKATSTQPPTTPTTARKKSALLDTTIFYTPNRTVRKRSVLKPRFTFDSNRGTPMTPYTKQFSVLTANLDEIAKAMTFLAEDED
jgi:hypothetical protein